MPRFDPERIALTRLVLALVGIVAVVAISVGIKDYVQQKTAKPPASTSTPTGVYSNPKTVPKKTTSAKTRQARMFATEANAPATAQAAADNMEEPLISEEFAEVGAKAIGVIDNAQKTVRAQAALDEVEAAMKGNNRVPNKFHTITDCVPLPNLTKPRDVDAAYYQNWAREYSCLF